MCVFDFGRGGIGGWSWVKARSATTVSTYCVAVDAIFHARRYLQPGHLEIPPS